MNLSLILVLANCAMREHARRHLMHVVVLLSLGAIGFAVSMSLLGGEAHTKILKDMATASLLFFGGVLAIMLSVVSIGPEVESRTILPVMARPVRRAEYVLGRYLGTVGTVFIALLIMAIVFAGALLLIDGEVGAAFPAVCVFVAAEVALLAAVGTTIGVFSSPPLAAVLSFFIFIAGSVKMGYGSRLAENLSGPSQWAGALLLHALPNLEAFDFRDALVHGVPIPGSYMAQVALYAILYSAAMLSIACLRFERREL